MTQLVLLNLVFALLNLALVLPSLDWITSINAIVALFCAFVAGFIWSN